MVQMIKHPRVIQIRGTSGSGKSTVMREIIGSAYTTWKEHYKSGRKAPLYYESVSKPWIILGHYLSPCGGCDTIGSAPKVYDLIQQFTHKETILCEGLLLSEDVKWSSKLMNLTVVFLDTPLDVCLKRIEQRRKSVGNDKPLNPSNTANRIAVIERSKRKLEQLGVKCLMSSSEKAAELILKLLEK